MKIFKVVANLLILNFVYARNVSKCCPQNQQLSINDLNNSEINRGNIHCRLTNHSMLMALDFSSLFIGFSNCSKFNLIDAYQKQTIVCQDRVDQLQDIYALKCVENESENNHEIASISSLRKCCPLNRKYDWDKQYCWNRFAGNYENSAIDLIRLTANRQHQLVNLSFGLPHCRKSDVLLDRVMFHDQIKFLNTDAIRVDDMNDSFILSFDEFCVDLVDDRFEFLVIRHCQDYITACKKNRQVCIRKCCSVGYELDGDQCIPSVRPFTVSVYNLTQKYSSEIVAVDIKSAFFQGNPCDDRKYVLNNYGKEKHILMTDGTVFMAATNTVLDINMYCMDNVRFFNKTRTFVCIHENKTVLTSLIELKPVLTSICAGISAFFLLLTFFIYSVLPSLRNLHGKLIMCYLIASAASYLMVVVHRTVPLQMLSGELCMVAGYVMLFTTLSSFCWLNVISYDIWFTFKIARSSFLKKSKTSRKLLLYSFYGWGCPLIWTVLAAASSYIFHTTNNPYLISEIAEKSCWFSDYGSSKITYFICPISIMVIFNSLIFISIVKYCSSIKAELNNTNNCNYTLKKYTVNRNELFVNIKLFILMGLNWSFEIIALIVQPHQRIFFILSDLLNGLIGLIIFCILIMKRKILYDLKKRLCSSKSNLNIERPFRSNLSTSSSNIQSALNYKRSTDRF